MKKSGLFIAVLSVMIFTSCEKEEEDMSSNIFLNESLTDTWDVERTPNIKEKGTSTSNKYGTVNGLVDEIKEDDEVTWETVSGLVDEVKEGDKVSFGTNSEKPNNNQLKSNGTIKFFNNSKGF